MKQFNAQFNGRGLSESGVTGCWLVGDVLLFATFHLNTDLVIAHQVAEVGKLLTQYKVGGWVGVCVCGGVTYDEAFL